MRLSTVICASAMALAALPGRADDPWELDADEDTAATRVHILPGQVQTGRDLQGGAAAPDQDWLFTFPLARHSYVARASGGPMWSANTFVAARLDRVGTNLAVLTAGTNEEMASFRGQSVYWIAGAVSDHEYLRVTGPPSLTGAAPYTLEFHDTTYAIPRWNNSASQTTIFLIQNNKPSPVAGRIFFYGTGGNLAHDYGLLLPANGLLVLPTASIPQLAGQNGSAHVAHTGGLGALSGKAVALEPATGFTFDTAMTPLQP
jgi:hypothetical protein